MNKDPRYGQTPAHNVFENDLIKLEKAQKALLCEISTKLDNPLTVTGNQTGVDCNDNPIIIPNSLLTTPAPGAIQIVKICESQFSILSNTVLDKEICLPDGTIVIKREVVSTLTGDTLITRYFTITGDVYTGDLTQLNNMICCCNKPTSSYTEETFLPAQGTNSVQLSAIPDMNQTIQVMRNGIVLEATEYSISGSTITFDVPFDASPGAVYNEIVIVKFYKPI